MRRRPTVVLLDGGPGSYDHSYFKPDFARLADQAQVVYLDLRGHGRSGWGPTAEWSFEVCADDIRTFCDALGIEQPIVLGHSMGGFVAMLYGARHPGHAGGIVLQSTMARFDLARLVAAVRRVAGDDVAALAERSSRRRSGPSPPPSWNASSPLFGPRVPDAGQLAPPPVQNLDPSGLVAWPCFASSTWPDQLGQIHLADIGLRGRARPDHPRLSAAREIFDALPDGVGQLAVLDGARTLPVEGRPESSRSS